MKLSFAKTMSQYLNFCNERYHKLQLKLFIKYLQPYTMKILSFVLSSLSFYMIKKGKEKDNKRQGNKIPYITIPTFKALLPSKTQNT